MPGEIMKAFKSCRAMEAMCRKYAKANPENRLDWLAEADKWKDLADHEALSSEERTATKSKARGARTVASSNARDGRRLVKG